MTHIFREKSNPCPAEHGYGHELEVELYFPKLQMQLVKSGETFELTGQA